VEKAGHFEQKYCPYLQGSSNLLSAWPTLWSHRCRWNTPPKSFVLFPNYIALQPNPVQSLLYMYYHC
jgi:hypothetical protein